MRFERERTLIVRIHDPSAVPMPTMTAVAAGGGRDRDPGTRTLAVELIVRDEADVALGGGTTATDTVGDQPHRKDVID